MERLDKINLIKGYVGILIIGLFLFFDVAIHNSFIINLIWDSALIYFGILAICFVNAQKERIIKIRLFRR